jgi:predicted transcriptional regulator
MASQANIGRMATAELLKYELKTISITAGLLLKTYRSYKRPGAPSGFTQIDIADQTGVAQSVISKIETGKQIDLSRREISDVLKACGVDVTRQAGKSLLELLVFLNEHESGLHGLKDLVPQ